MKLPQYIKINVKQAAVLILFSFVVLYSIDQYSKAEQIKYREKSFSYICTVVKPRLQLGAQREVQDTLVAVFKDDIQNEKVFPGVTANNNYIIKKNFETEHTYVCGFESNPSVKVVYSYNLDNFSKYQYLIFCCLIFLVSTLSMKLAERILENRNQERIKYETALELSAVARQVAHDIRSPLSALTIVVDTFRGDERRELIMGVGDRIKSIADDLLLRYKVQSRPEETVDKKLIITYDLARSIQKIIEEKMVIAPHIDFQFNKEDISFLVHFDARELERIFANLVQNSIEALTSKPDPQISIYLRRYAESLQISVIDNGIGISDEVKSKLGKEIITSKGHSGNGLGVVYAANKLNDWGGTISFESKPGLGTAVNITLPLL